jgi:hypothetical protein
LRKQIQRGWIYWTHTIATWYHCSYWRFGQNFQRIQPLRVQDLAVGKIFILHTVDSWYPQALSSKETATEKSQVLKIQSSALYFECLINFSHNVPNFC